jgi:hypothetical protein
MITRRTHKRESISLIGELGKRGKNMYLDGVADEAKVNMMCWS